MHAAFCTGPRHIELRDIPRPQPGEGEVLIAVHACGICGSDLHYFAGGADPPAVCLGHEICGRVVGDAGGLSAGTAVVVEPLVACGRCGRCLAGEPNLCPELRILGSMLAGGLAETVTVPVSSLYPVPADVDLDLAMLAEPLAVGVHAARLAEIHHGDTVMVLGGGTIGLLAAFSAVRRGARVTLSARHAHQQSAALRLGVAEAISADEAAVRSAARGHRPDVVLESVGGEASTMDLALRIVRAGGRVVALGKFNRPIALDPLRFLMKEVRIVSSMTYCRAAPAPDFVTALGYLRDSGTSLAPLITHRVALAEVERGFAIAADKSSGAIKVAVDVAA